MKNFELKFDLKSILQRFKSNTALVFYLILAVILILDARVFYAAAKQIWLSRQTPDNLPISQGVRFNFTDFEAAVERINAGKDFEPKTPLYKNPFGSK